MHRPHKPGSLPSPARPLTTPGHSMSARRSRAASETPSAPADAITSPVIELRNALRGVPLSVVVTEVVQHLILNQSFGSPFAVLEAEYTKQMSESFNLKSALYTTTTEGEGSSHQKEAPKHHASAPPLSHALSRDDFQQQYLALHSAYTKQSMDIVAREERIARLCGKVTELTTQVHLLKQTIVATSDKGAAAKVAVAEVTEESATTIDLSPAATIQHLQELNLILSQRIDTLEHNISLGWVFCEPEFLQEMNRRQAEIDRLTTLCEDLATAYLHVSSRQEESKSRTELLESDLATSNRRRDQLEKDVLALRIALERSRNDVM
jgi:hypothetical protein